MFYFKKFLYLFVLIGYSLSHAGSYDDFFTALKRNDVAAVEELLTRGFDPNSVSPDGQYAVMLALRQNAFAVAQLLIAHPATLVEVRSDKDESPLMLAAIKGKSALCMQLIERNADVNKQGWTALHYAASGGHADTVRLLLVHYAYIDAESPNRTTPLMMAAMYGNEDTVRVLLEAGADVTIKNALGLTALDFAQKGKSAGSVPLILAAVQALNAKAGW